MVKLVALALPITVVNVPVAPDTLPPIMLPVALINPAVLTLPPVTLPAALMNPVRLNPEPVRIATLALPPTSPVISPPEPRTVQFDVPLANCVAATLDDTVTLLKNPPSPMKNPPAVAITLPVALTTPVLTFNPIMLPDALKMPALTLAPVMLPVTV